MGEVTVHVDSPPPYCASSPPVYGAAEPGVVNVAVVEQPCPAVVSNVVVVGALCPSCKMGILEEEFTGCGICMGICFFPIGILCCFLMRERRCKHCRAKFG